MVGLLLRGREKRRREKREREKRRKEEEEEEKKGRREVQGEEEIRFGYVRNFGMNLCMELVRILYGYLFGGLEYLFLCRIIVWNGCLVWLWSLMEENFV